MAFTGDGKALRVYIGEADHWQGKPLYQAIVELLRAEGLAGATVLRGVAGFGANSRLHTAHLLRLSQDLPLVIETVDRAEQIAAVLPRLKEMVQQGLITLADVEIVHDGGAGG
ncbi:MAG TPA: DUF190 domain-containing protein [Thermomicrobiaceae bacterium]|nr:DUF190 domain-containing protein [Thermomicrobiaceae bacterium]